MELTTDDDSITFLAVGDQNINRHSQLHWRLSQSFSDEIEGEVSNRPRWESLIGGNACCRFGILRAICLHGLAYSDGNIVMPFDDPNMVSLSGVSSCTVGLNSCPFLLKAVFVDPVDSAIVWVVVDEGDRSRALTCSTASKVVDMVGRHASIATVRILGVHA